MSRPGPRTVRRRRFVPRLDELGARLVPAVTATFTPATGFLRVVGDDLDNTITVSRTLTGRVLVNGGAVVIGGGTPTVTTVSLIEVDGNGGNDTLTATGALPPAFLFGGAGNDTLTGGNGNDQLSGQGGNDTLFGRGGDDSLFGGADPDVLVGGTGDDRAFGDAGNDRMVWNPGDGTDLNEGGTETDTVEVNGGGGAEVFTATANGTRVRFDRVSPAPFSIDIGTSENLVLNANGGNDTFSATGNLAALIKLTVDGGVGNDTLLGSNGIDLLLGGAGSDFLDGNLGNDVALMGAGNDVFQWDPGDGSDTVEGQDGADRLLFNGSPGAETFNALVNGGRVLFTRDLSNIVMDLNDVERLDLNMLGGADTLVVNDLTGTDLARINARLAGPTGVGDGALDTVFLGGTNGNDATTVAGAAGGLIVRGLSAVVAVTGAEATDQLSVIALGGNDVVNAGGLPAGRVGLVVDAGAGDDTVFGSAGIDFLIGGAGNDRIDSNAGADGAQLGTGDDTFVWNPGDGADGIEGQDGTDRLAFNGSGVGEAFTVTSNGGLVRVLRNLDGAAVSANDVEGVDLNARGGADIVTVNDLAGTDVTDVRVNLGGDTSGDTLLVNGTAGTDVLSLSGGPGGATVTGLAAVVSVTGTAGGDRLTISTGAGADTISATDLRAGAVRLTEDGGEGDDLLVGSRGADTLIGGLGNDVLFGEAGTDVLDGAPGDDVVLQSPPFVPA